MRMLRLDGDAGGDCHDGRAAAFLPAQRRRVVQEEQERGRIRAGLRCGDIARLDGIESRVRIRRVQERCERSAVRRDDGRRERRAVEGPVTA